MTHAQFEDLPVWQKAAELYEATEELLENQSFVATSKLPLAHPLGVTKQMRATLKSEI